MKNLIILSFLLSIILPQKSRAQSWIHVSGFSYYDAFGAIEVDEGQWRVRVLVDNISPSATTFGPSKIEESVYDCRIPKMLFISETWYSRRMAEGEITEYFEISETDRQWERIFFDSDGIIRELLCNY
jgi:hypothetical protein